MRLGYQLHPNGEVLNGVLFSLGGLLLKQTCIQFPRIGVGKLFLQTFGIEQRRVVRFLQQSSSEILLAVLNELEDLHGNNTVALLSNHFAATVFVLLTLQNGFDGIAALAVCILTQSALVGRCAVSLHLFGSHKVGQSLTAVLRKCVGLADCFFFSSRRRHTRLQGDWSSDVCSS